MTWTNTNSPGTTSAAARRDAIRLLIKDLSSGSQLITDEAIAFYLAQNNNNVYRAGRDAARSIAARQGKSKSVGDLSITGLGDNYLEIAAELDRRANATFVPAVGGISIGDKQTQEADTDRVTPAFFRTLQENPNVDNASKPATT